MIKELIATCLLSGTIAFNGAVIPSKSVHVNAIYDDNSYTITLTADELNNYTFPNLVDKFLNVRLEYAYATHIDYNGYTYSANYSYADVNAKTIYYANNNLADKNVIKLFYNIYQVDYSLKPLSFGLYTASDNPFVYYDFEYDLTLYVDMPSIYAIFKEAVELDIIANTTPVYDSFYDGVYNYFYDVVFNSESLDDFSYELFGVTLSLRSYLSHTGAIISVIMVVVIFISFILMLCRMVGALFYNFGR